jgi:hypothetical protein
LTYHITDPTRALKNIVQVGGVEEPTKLLHNSLPVCAKLASRYEDNVPQLNKEFEKRFGRPLLARSLRFSPTVRECGSLPVELKSGKRWTHEM